MYAGAPMLTVAAAMVAACTSTPGPTPAPRSPSLQAARTLSPPAERAIRYYLDDAGTTWDDRGKRHDAAPSLR